MERTQFHYEVLVQRRPDGPFGLDGAFEARAAALEAANLAVDERRALTVRVVKEALDPRSREFSSVVIFERGSPRAARRRRPAKAQSRYEPRCASPQDLYGLHARETIARLLEPWLARNGVTVWELLHRADLLELLEASGVEVRHALQTFAAGEAQTAGASVHEVMRIVSALTASAIERVCKDAKRRVFPNLDAGLAEAADALAGQPDRAYRLAGGVASALADADDWNGKLASLLDLAEQAMAAGKNATWLLAVLEQPLSELLESRASLRDLLGEPRDLGADLGALTRLVAGAEADRLGRRDPRLAALLPPISGPAVRLSRFLDAGAFPAVRRAVAKRILSELDGPRRLRPTSAVEEITLLRALAMTLTAAGPGLVDVDDLRRAFVDRSRGLLAPEFIGPYLADAATALAEAQSLVWLADNVAGLVNKRAAARLIAAHLDSRRLELELRAAAPPPAARLAELGRLQKAVARAGFQPEDAAALQARIGDLGAVLETEVGLIAALLRADAEASHKLFLLAKLASGESAPAGPVTDRARAEALKLMRTAAVREQLAGSADLRGRLATLLPAAA